MAHSAVRLAFPVAFEAAIDLDDLREADLLADIARGSPAREVPPFLRAQLARARGLIAAARGEDGDVEDNLVAAEAGLRDLGYPYWLARVQLDRAEWLSRQGRLEESGCLAREAAETLDAIGAAPTLVRRQVLDRVPCGRVPERGGAPLLDVGDGKDRRRLLQRLADVHRPNALDIRQAPLGQPVGGLHPSLGHEDAQVGPFEPVVTRGVDPQVEGTRPRGSPRASRRTFGRRSATRRPRADSVPVLGAARISSTESTGSFMISCAQTSAAASRRQRSLISSTSRV